jgi:hypothetical protein
LVFTRAAARESEVERVELAAWEKSVEWDVIEPVAEEQSDKAGVGVGMMERRRMMMEKKEIECCVVGSRERIESALSWRKEENVLRRERECVGTLCIMCFFAIWGWGEENLSFHLRKVCVVVWRF